MQLPVLDNASFEEKIYDAEETCLVVFSRKDCHVCKEVVPMVEDLAGSSDQDPFKFYRVDVEEQPALYESFSLKGVPSILFFRDGEYKGKLSGKIEEEQILEKIEKIS